MADDGAAPVQRSPSTAPGGQFLRRATTVSSLTALGVAAGFLVDVLIVARFGVGAQTDAFFGGYTIPLILVTCLTAVEPVLVTILASYRSDESACGVLLNATVLISAIVTVLGALLARPLIKVILPGFAPAVADQATHLAQILFIRVPPTAVAEVCKSELYVRRRFGLATFSGVIPSLVTAFLLILPGTGSNIDIVALGFVAGTLAQALLLAGALFGALRVPYRWTLRHSAPILSQSGRLMLAPVAGLLLRQGVTLAERFFGSTLPTGSVTALSYAGRLTMTVAGVAYDGITTASLPSLAERWSQGAREAFRSQLAMLLTMMTTVAVPLGLMVTALGSPLVRLLFQRGQVNPESALLMGAVLSTYSLSLPFLGPFRVVQNYFYAVKETRPIVFLHGGLTALTVILDWALVGPLGAVGLALAFALSCAIMTVVSLLWLAWRIGDLGWRRFVDSFWRLGLTSVATASVVFGFSHWIETAARGTGQWGLVLSVIVGCLLGLAVFVGLGSLLRLEAILLLRNKAREKWATRI